MPRERRGGLAALIGRHAGAGWMPWVAAALVWNLSFDYQLRAAGARFADAQLERRARGEAAELIANTLLPARPRAAFASTLLAGTVLVAARAWSSRRRLTSDRTGTPTS